VFPSAFPSLQFPSRLLLRSVSFAERITGEWDDLTTSGCLADGRAEKRRGGQTGELNSLAGEASSRGSLNKSARTAFTEPIGRTQREQDLPWDASMVAAPRRWRPEILDFHHVFVSAKGAVGPSLRAPAISVTARTPSVYGWFIAGMPRNGSECVGSGRKFVRSGQRPPESRVNASRV